MSKINKLYKIFNRNTVKIRYSCMSNISSIILGHNKESNCYSIWLQLSNQRRLPPPKSVPHTNYYLQRLSKYIWSLKDAGTSYTINWSIVAKVKGSRKINYCTLCFTEKYQLTEYFNDICLLNKNSEIVNAYRNQSKLLLPTLKRHDSMD